MPLATQVVLCIPSPARWLLLTAEQAGQEAVPPDPDHADTAAMYVVGLLRIFAVGDLIDPEAYCPVHAPVRTHEVH